MNGIISEKLEFVTLVVHSRYSELSLGLKKKFVSCNPTLTSFYSKKSLP